jgi:hypothetical protein
MKWSETSIARALALQFFNRKYLCVVPNCNWPGSECDVLCVTENLRLIDVEIKISRSDLKADAKKEKWWRNSDNWRFTSACGGFAQAGPPCPKLPEAWPNKVWKHYYALPKEIWKPELLDCLPSPNSGVLLLSDQQHDGKLIVTCARQSKPNRNADKLTPEQAVNVARLASLRMWESYRQVEEMRRAA